MKKVIINVMITFCMVLVAKTIGHITKPIIRQKFFSQIEYQDTQIKNKIDNNIDKLYYEQNNYFNNKTFEEIQKDFKMNTKDDVIAELAIPLGFFGSVDVIIEFCEPTGYIPEKFIAKVNSYKKGVDFDKKFINIFVNAVGANKPKVLYAGQTLLIKQKELLRNQGMRLLEDDYINTLKNDPSFTKKEYCKIYDDYAEEMIFEKIQRIKDVAPSTYKKYFINNTNL